MEWPSVYLELSLLWEIRLHSEAELVRWREYTRMCQGCKLYDEEASIPGLLVANASRTRNPALPPTPRLQLE